MIDFSITPDFQEKLDWIRAFVHEKVEPLDVLFDVTPDAPWDWRNPQSQALLKPLQKIVKEKGLWALHLPPNLGGGGLGNVPLTYVNEILGRSQWAPMVFGTQAPDTGNAEILAHYAAAEQKQAYLQPLLDGDIYSCFCMTEVEGGGDPTQLTTTAELQGDEWVISGEKWFASNAQYAKFMIVIARTENEDAPRHERFSAFVVPADAPGLEIIREVGLAGEPYGTGAHPHLRFDNVRVPKDGILGPRGHGFQVAQTRLAGGRIHHAMRTVGATKMMLEMMMERAVSRFTQGELLSRKQLVQVDIADCWIMIEQLQLLILRTAWLLDNNRTEEARLWIGACKVRCAEVYEHVLHKSSHLLGSLGISNMTPLGHLYATGLVMGMSDGPTEIHQMQVGRILLKSAKPAPGRFPTCYLPDLKEKAEKYYAKELRENAG